MDVSIAHVEGLRVGVGAKPIVGWRREGGGSIGLEGQWRIDLVIEMSYDRSGECRRGDLVGVLHVSLIVVIKMVVGKKQKFQVMALGWSKRKGCDIERKTETEKEEKKQVKMKRRKEKKRKRITCRIVEEDIL